MSLTCLLFLSALVAARTLAASTSGGIVIGECVEMCNPNPVVSSIIGLTPCPVGYECKPNGCGHNCEISHVKKQVICPSLACTTFCPNGHVLSLHTFCPTCECKL